MRGLMDNPVITLSILKRPGENLIETSDNVKQVVERMKANQLPPKLDVVITGDLSNATRTSLNDLVNSIVIGFYPCVGDTDVLHGSSKCILCCIECAS
jgi:multidrug efflux pump subunit AcrB